MVWETDTDLISDHARGQTALPCMTSALTNGVSSPSGTGAILGRRGQHVVCTPPPCATVPTVDVGCGPLRPIGH